MNPNEMNIIVWALALLVPILPALLFFIPKSSTAEASTDDSHAEKSPPEKVPFWAKWYNIPLGDYYLEVWASNPQKHTHSKSLSCLIMICHGFRLISCSESGARYQR